MVSQPKILLVDDEEAITSNLAPFLERAGFTVEVAGDGEEALRRVADASTELGEVFSPDLIVLDVLMPRLDGREVCRHLRVAGNWTPIIKLTQVGSPAERAMSWRRGLTITSTSPSIPTSWWPASAPCSTAPVPA